MMEYSKKLGIALLICLGVALGGVPGAFAQDGDDDFMDDEFMLETITVTAQKRDENQQNVAIAMDVVSSEEMDKLGWNNVDEILSNISNVIINTSSDGMRVSLRGLADDAGLNRNVKTSTPTVAVNMDGAYNSNSTAGMNLYDVERVEVLFGPQSTMYASNSPGGVINVVTASPKTDKFSASASLEYGSYDLINVNGAVNVPLSEVAAFRTAFAWNERDSFVSDEEAGEESKSARLKALYEPSEEFSMTLTGSYSVSSNGGMMGGQIEAFDDQDGNYADGTEITDPWTAADTSGDPMGGGSGNSSDQDTWSSNLNIAWDTPVGALTIVPSYTESTSSQDETMSDPFTGESNTTHQDIENFQKGGEVRISSPADSGFKWIAGANYYKSKDERDKTFITQDYENGLTILQDETFAVFGNITYPLTDALRATGGYRYSWDEMYNFEYDPSMPQADATSPDNETEQEYSSPDTKIGIEYDMADNAMLYIDRSTSYRMQAMGQKNSEGVSIPPEELVSYTIGAKTRFLDNKLQLNMAAYYYDYKNKLANQRLSGTYNEGTMWDTYAADYNYDTSFFDYDGDGEIEYGDDGNNQIEETNSQGWGDFTSFGVDIQASVILTGKDKVELSVSYLDATWENLEFDYVYDYIWPDESFNGMRNTYSPEWTVNGSYDHNFTLWNGGSLNARVDCQYQSSYVLTWKPAVTSDGYRYDYQEDSYIFNLSTVYSHPSGMWSLSGYVKNVFDYAKKTSCMTMEMDGELSSVTMMLNDPRTYGVMVSMDF
jgi:iron complex outermembrane receptor protein